MATRLDRELRAYEAARARLLRRSRNKFVLVKGCRIVGVFDGVLDALRRGYEEFGNRPFLVRQVLREDAPRRRPAFRVVG